jgi:hypothetical protein
MESTIVASFSTRRDAELAVEHIVQEHGIDRADVFVQAAGAANSAGQRAAGADTQSGRRDSAARGQPDLNGPVEVSVDLHSQDAAARVEGALKQAGATRLRTN